MGDPSPILTVLFPTLFGLTFIAVSALGCRMRAQHQRLMGLEMRVGALEMVPPPRLLAPPAPPVYQLPPSAPPMMDPMPPAHLVVGMPTVAAVAQMQRYTAYI